MTTSTSCTLRVGIGSLARAIAAVARHAEKSKPGDEQPMTCRVRLIADRGRLKVCATDGRTSALAWVEILADSRPGTGFAKDDGPLVVDLRPRHARELADAIVPNRVDGDDVGDASLDLALDVVTITDVSGKYPNTSHTVPVIEQESTMTLEGTDHLGYPDIPGTLKTAAREAAGIFKSLRPPASMLARFGVAEKLFGSLIYEPVGDATAGAWLVWARDGGFVGQLDNRHADDAERRRELSARMRLLARLGLMTEAEVAAAELAAGPPPEPDDPDDDEREDDEDEPDPADDEDTGDDGDPVPATVRAIRAAFSHTGDDDADRDAEGFAPTGDDDELDEDGEG